MKKKPSLVSINIRTFNSEKTLEQTLKSVKEQTYPHIEILVSDGYSEDKTVEIAKSYGAKVHYAQKLGDARYQNYKHSQGKYILSLDSDQILEKEVVAACVAKCENEGYDALTICEKSIIKKGTVIEKLIAYDKWLIDKMKDDDVVFGTACPRFFKKKLLKEISWSKGLSIFDDTLVYSEILKKGARVTYLAKPSIRHYEVDTLRVFFKKFYRYGKGYFGAFKEQPGAIMAHSLPRRSYFSKTALTKPYYFLGLLLLYLVKSTAAFLGLISYFVSKFTK